MLVNTPAFSQSRSVYLSFSTYPHLGCSRFSKVVKTVPFCKTVSQLFLRPDVSHSKPKSTVSLLLIQETEGIFQTGKKSFKSLIFLNSVQLFDSEQNHPSHPGLCVESSHLSDAPNNTDRRLRETFYLRFKGLHLYLKPQSHLRYFCRAAASLHNVSKRSQQRGWSEERNSKQKHLSINGVTNTLLTHTSPTTPPLASAAIDAHRNFMNFKL